jgi:hypothetical protein
MIQEEMTSMIYAIKVWRSGLVHFGGWTNIVVTFNSSQNTTLHEGTCMHH